MINWKVSKEDSKKINLIVNRAISYFKKHGVEVNRLTCDMDITACHANGNPIDLDRLLDAPDFDFLHDVAGIHKYIDRKTGKLTNCFVPRMSAKQTTLSA